MSLNINSEIFVSTQRSRIAWSYTQYILNLIINCWSIFSEGLQYFTISSAMYDRRLTSSCFTFLTSFGLVCFLHFKTSLLCRDLPYYLLSTLLFTYLWQFKFIHLWCLMILSNLLWVSLTSLYFPCWNVCLNLFLHLSFFICEVSSYH